VAAPTARLQTETFWRVLNLLLVAFLFVLLGFQVPGIVTGVSRYLIGTLLLVSTSLIVVIVAIRLGWVLLVPSLLARFGVRGEGLARLSRAELLLVGWCGPRGAVSLAVALSIPLTASGAPFIRRELLLFLTVVVVMVTLEAQVMLLPALVRWLRLSPDERERTEGLRARRATVKEALRELENAEAGDEHEPPAVHALRHVLELRHDRLLQQLESQSGDHSDARADGEVDIDGRALRQRLIEAERRTLHQLHADGQITARTMHEISQELDLDEARLHDSDRPPH
jgi:CPA1 family monovalent cation:H+ antiporter